VSTPPRILIACIGNIFLGDDAFGVHVARALGRRTFPPHVRVVDFGIRGIDLTYALLDGCDIAVLVDAVPRGDQPGTLYLIEAAPAADAVDADAESPPAAPDLLEAHAMHPAKVLRLVRQMGGGVRRVLVLGCEPAPPDPGSDSDLTGDLSPPVARAVEPAVQMLESLVARLSTDPLTTEVSHEVVALPA
jgi:hydrogenase maturation protease